MHDQVDKVKSSKHIFDSNKQDVINEYGNDFKCAEKGIWFLKNFGVFKNSKGMYTY